VFARLPRFLGVGEDRSKTEGKTDQPRRQKDSTGYGIGRVYRTLCDHYIGVNLNGHDGGEIQRDFRARVASRVRTVCARRGCKEGEFVQPNDGRIPEEGLDG